MGWFGKSEKTDKKKTVAIKTDRKETLTVRGVDFFIQGNGYIPLNELTKLHLLFKAIEGDSLACEILDAAGTKMQDAEGNIIYPLPVND